MIACIFVVSLIRRVSRGWGWCATARCTTLVIAGRRCRRFCAGRPGGAILRPSWPSELAGPRRWPGLTQLGGPPSQGGVALLKPTDDQEVWAAGVTYERSRDRARRGVGRQWDLRSGLQRGAAGAVLQGHAQPHRRPGRAGGHPRRRSLERARAGAGAGGQPAAGAGRLHDRQRHELARYRRREPAVPAPGQGLRALLRARAADRAARQHRRPDQPADPAGDLRAAARPRSPPRPARAGSCAPSPI